MTLEEYQDWVETLMGADEQERAAYALGIAGEAGEVADLLKKVWAHNKPLDLGHLQKELGDVLWYVAALASQHGICLEGVAQANIEKLEKRYPDGWQKEYRPNSATGTEDPDDDDDRDTLPCLPRF